MATNQRRKKLIHHHLRQYIIQPTLNRLNLYSEDAEELLVFTCAVESDGGKYLVQIGGGPALGIYQCEPATHHDIWINFVRHKLDVQLMMGTHFGGINSNDHDRLVYDLRYATAIARLHYLRVKAPLPKKSNLDQIWAYYKEHYNTLKGRSEKRQSLEKYWCYVT